MAEVTQVTLEPEEIYVALEPEEMPEYTTGLWDPEGLYKPAPYAEPTVTDLSDVEGFGPGWEQVTVESLVDIPSGPFVPTNGDFSWQDILGQFGYYPPALSAVAAAIANPTYQNIRAVEWAYRQGGYEAPGPLMNWLWGKYYATMPQRLPGEVGGFVGDYWPVILIGLAALFILRK